MKVIIVDSATTDKHCNELVAEINGHYPEVDIYIVPRSGDFPENTITIDSLLLLLFESDQISDNYSNIIEKYKHETVSAGRYLPIACGNAKYLRGELSNFKSIPVSDVKSMENIIRRIGAYLGLATIPKENEIFISYRVSDGVTIATKLSEYFRSLGFNVWRDDDRDEDNEGQLVCGEDVQTKIRHAIQSSNLVLLVDTPDAPDSKWVREELDCANANLVPIIPVCVREHHSIKGSHFRHLKSLNRYIETNNSLHNLEEISTLAQSFLMDVYKRRRKMPVMVGKKFLRTGYTWKEIELQKLLFGAEKKQFLRLKRILSHLPVYEGVHHPVLNHYIDAIKKYPARCNENLFIYDGCILTQTDINEIFKENQNAEFTNVTLLHHEQVDEFLKEQ